MGIVLDVILIVIILLNVIICYKKGLVKLAVGLVAVIVSLILAMILYKPVTNIIIKNTEIDEKIKESIINTLTTESNENDTSDKGMMQYMQSYVDDAVNKTKNEIVIEASEVVSTKIINVCAFLGIFVVVRILAILLTIIADLIMSLPILKQFNKAGGIEWIISPHGYWRDRYLKLLLNPLHADGTPITDPDVIAGTKNCDDFEWPWGCHTAVPLPNGHIFYFNNGYGRNFKLDFTDRKNVYTCGIEYEVDEVNRTVRQVWQYGKERGTAYFTPARSGVQYLEQTGNRLICPGMSNVLSNGNRGARVTEVDPETQEIVFELELEDAIYQRVYRMSLYPDNQ